jgi:CBS domain-containing protein
MYSDEIANALRTRHVQTQIARVVSFDEQAQLVAARDEMSRFGFDHAPVTRGGDICGFVCHSDLAIAAGSLRDQVRPLAASRLIAGDTPLVALMDALTRAAFLFVVEGTHIGGVVTPSDLNKQPGRTYFYMLVAALEMNLAERARAFFPRQDVALALLSDGRRDGIQQRLESEARDDVLSDTVAAMDLADLLMLVEKTDELRSAFGAYSRNRWANEVSKPVINLRHDVMHTVRTLANDAPSSLKRLTALDELLRGLLAAEEHPDTSGQ